MAVTSLSDSPQESPSCLLLVWEALQDQQVGLTQGPFKLLRTCWVSECVKFLHAPFKSRSSISYSPLAPLNTSPPGLQNQCLSCAAPMGWGAQCRAQTPCTYWKTSAVVVILQFISCLLRGVGLDCTGSLFLLPSYYVLLLLFLIFSCRRSFLLIFVHSH